MKIYYHVADLDGKCSAAIACRKYPNAKLIGYNYYYDPGRSFANIDKDEDLLFVDITPPIETLKGLLQLTQNITIIDHHKTAIEDLKEANLSFKGIMDDTGIGACNLVWRYLFPDLPVPMSVIWIAEHDVWRNTTENKVFHFGLGSQNTYPTSSLWDKLFEKNHPVINYIIRDGKAILGYLTPWYKMLVRSYGVPGIIDGHKAIILNQGGVNSFVFDSVINQYDVFVRCVKGRDTGWMCSITTEKSDIDVSVIAKRFGGGGHVKAAGFRVEKLEDFFVKDVI